MTSIVELLPKPTPRTAKVILIEHKIVVAATCGGGADHAGSLSAKHVVLPTDVDDQTLFKAICDHLWKHEHAVQLPGPKHSVAYDWLERPEIVADVDVVESTDTLELRFPIPGTEMPSGPKVFAREVFKKEVAGYAMARHLKRMLQVRRHLLTITGAPKTRARDGSPAAA